MQHPPAPSDFCITVLLFGGMRDALHANQIEVTLSPTATSQVLCVADLLLASAKQFPVVASWLPHIRVAVNHEYANPQTTIKIGDEIAFIPPVAGG